MIKVENLSMSFGSFMALDDISFEVGKGEVVGLLGPNGAGKSTTMKILTTYLYPKSGRALVGDFDVVDDPMEVRARIGYLPEILPLYSDMEVRDYLVFVGRARNLSSGMLNDRLDWLVKTLGLEDMYRKLCRELSKGFRQRVGLAQALIHDPDIVILDEPTSGLDPHQIQEIRRLVRELGRDKTVILSTHVLQEAQAVSDRLVIINRGRIVGDGTLDELRDRAHELERTLLAVKGDAGDIQDKLRGITGLKEIIPLDTTDDYVNFELIADIGTRVWTRVGEIAQINNWQVGLLKDDPYTLEETFMALTSADTGGGEV